MKLTTTKQNSRYVNAVIYGKAGVGKTVLGATAPRPLIIDADRGTLSISDDNLPVIRVDDFDDLEDVFDYLSKKKNIKKYETLILDSASAVAEHVLRDLKGDTKDDRQAYMALGDKTLDIFRWFRELKIHVVYICKEKVVSSDGVDMHKLSFPGQALGEKVPYLVDEILALRMGDKEDDDDDPYRFLQTQPSFDWDAKDRSGTLDFMEEPNLTKLFKKILKGKKSKK